MNNRLVLSRDDIIKLLARADFYKETGGVFNEVGLMLQAVQPAFIESAKTRCCGGDPSILFPSIDRFLEILKTQPETQQPFRNFHSAKKGYTIGKVAIYYRKGREPSPYRLEF